MSEPQTDTILAFVPGPESGYDVVFEQDAKVAYAYLRAHGRIVADVWLYNCGPPPADPEWHDRAALPFANPQRFAWEEAPPVVTAPAQIECRWFRTAEGKVGADVFILGRWYGRVVAGAKPGWARLARRDGPLALR